MEFIYKYRNYRYLRSLDKTPNQIRFKRDIEDVHALWMRASERSRQRRKVLNDCMKEIIAEIPKSGRDTHIVYFNRKDSEHLFKYVFSWHEEYKSYGVSNDRADDKTREERLELFTATDRAYELGQKYHDLKKMITNHADIVFRCLWSMVEDILRENVKGCYCNGALVKFQIADRKYYAQVNDKSNSRMHFFDFMGECTDDAIEIKTHGLFK